MASKKKKKGGRKTGATTRAKTKAGARKAKASPRKAKASPRKAKAGARKTKAATPKTKAKAKRAPVTVAAKAKPPAPEQPSSLVIIDEVIEESLLDVSTVLRIKDGVARSQRDVDEDERKQFSDPSLVVEAERSQRREDDTDPSISHLPDLFAAEARRQKERLGDRPVDAAQKPRDSSLFGSVGVADDDDDPDET